MNYYQFDIGDWRSHARFLTTVERALYREALDEYYATERPLNSDNFDLLARRLLAQSDEEKEALRTILGLFFTLKDDGYHHNRCDEEILKYQSLIESASRAGRASAARKANAKSTTVERPLNDRATNQEPRTNNHKPIEKEKRIKKEKVANAQIPKPPDVDEEVWNDFLQMRKSKQAPVTQTAILGIEREANKAGVSLQDALQTCCAQGWRGFKAEWIERRKSIESIRQREYVPTFKERDQRRAMEEMEQWTGRTHPELARMRQMEGQNVIDITPLKKMERLA
jgi:uncharacterized protein YdaU (DUF1376 family)